MGDLVISFLLKLRNRHFLIMDVLAFLVTPAIALILRIDDPTTLASYGRSLLVATLAFLCIKVAIFYLAGLYRVFWHYASIDELAQIAIAGIATLFVQTLIFFTVLRPCGWVSLDFPRSVPLIDCLLTVPVVGGVRYSVRLAERIRQRASNHGNAKRVLVAGAGQSGVMIVKEMQSNPALGLYPVAFVDDNPEKYHVKIQGISVLGDHRCIPELVRTTDIHIVIIAMPTAPGKVIREIVDICEQVHLPTKIIPGIHELLDRKISVRQLRDVQIEDLLRRKPVSTDVSSVRELIRGKRVLITGAGGSIGSELCRQILWFEPAELVLLGHGENSIFAIHNELLGQLTIERQQSPSIDTNGLKVSDSDVAKARSSCRLETAIADIRFPERLQAIFEEHRPEIVFHAAAHKHVPLMELNPTEAITNNVLGTRNLLDVSLAMEVEHFVMVSTDKAVNPTSIMGASKRVTELLVHQAAVMSGKPYLAVRFGNVLGSRGSAVLTFKQQIAAGGPVTVTHPEMCRYFMLIPEAVQLLLQAAALGHGGEVFMLDMGEPVKIVDLARDMIELSGLEVGRDIDIVFTGIRPGEKLYEELFIPGEVYQPTVHEKIFIAGNSSTFVPMHLNEWIRALEIAAQRNDRTGIALVLESLAWRLQSDDERWSERLRTPEPLQVQAVGAG
jgi:FlaA1/EpsC-like NDP-sugar epimerase